MSFIDDQITGFYDHMASVSMDIADYERWMADYEKMRYSYPDWVTKDGTHHKVCELSDSHLENLIAFIKKHDPENKTHWYDVFDAERTFRKFKEKVEQLKKEYAEMQKVSDMCC